MTAPTPRPRLRRWLLAALWLWPLTACSAEPPEVPAHWKTDCAGRVQVSLPGDVELVSSHDRTIDRRLWLGPPDSDRDGFPDGQEAGYWERYYAQNRIQDIEISAPRPPDQIERWFDAARWRPPAEKKLRPRWEFPKDGVFISRDRTKFKYRPLPIDEPNTLVWMGFKNEAWFTKRFPSTLMLFSARLAASTPAELRAEAQAMARRVRLRPFGEVPREPGVCLPYAFIRDEGQDDQPVSENSIAYRLVEHPDILLVVYEAGSGEKYDHHKPRRFTDADVVEDEWQRGEPDIKVSRQLWRGGGRKFSMGGRQGHAFFYVVSHPDSSLDYRFHARTSVPPGNGDRKTWLALRVIGDSRYAQKKGIAPLGEHDFLKLALTVAASIKMRPVEP